jgi:hypothetical protein
VVGDVKTNKGFATVANVAGVKIRIGSVNIPAVASGNRMDTLTHGENFSSKESYIVIAKVCEVHGSLGGAVFTTYECRPANTTQFIIRWSHNWPSALTAVVYYVVIGT